jgi:hypothetical protein
MRKPLIAAVLCLSLGGCGFVDCMLPSTAQAIAGAMPQVRTALSGANPTAAMDSLVGGVLGQAAICAANAIAIAASSSGHQVAAVRLEEPKVQAAAKAWLKLRRYRCKT